MQRREFTDTWDLAAPVPGWLTRAQAEVLYDAAAAVPQGGTIVEIGSHRGRSTTVLAGAAGGGVRVVAIDPFDPHWRYGATDTERSLRDHLEAAGLAGVVDVRAGTSRAALAAWEGTVDLVYVDGKHDWWSVRHDLGWTRWVMPGGTVLVHDAFGSVGVTVGLLTTLLTGRTLVYVDRTGSLARLRVAHPSLTDRVRPLGGLPWFTRNLIVKLLLRLGLRGIVARLGHHDTADPY